MFSDRLGAWVLQSFAERVAAPEPLQALPWRDDRLFAYRRGLDDVVSVWKLRLDNAANAEQLLASITASALNQHLHVAFAAGSDLTLVLTEDPGSAEAWRAVFASELEAAHPDAGVSDTSPTDAGGAPAARDAAVSYPAPNDAGSALVETGNADAESSTFDATAP
jgi:hypothetical protein